MVEKKTWDDFRDSGLFWWINIILHTFGWALVCDLDENDKVTQVLPARVKYRGFSEESNDKGYAKVTEYMKNNAGILKKEVDENP